MGKSLAELFGPQRAAAGAIRGRAGPKAPARAKPSPRPSKKKKQPLAQIKKRRPKKSLGLLEETQAEHEKRHRSKAERDECPRCQFAAGAFRCFPWLQVCPTAAGAWRLGCKPCAAAGLAPGRARKSTMSRHCWQPRPAKAFELTMHLRQHTTTLLHRQAVQLASAQALPPGSRSLTSGAAKRNRKAMSVAKFYADKKRRKAGAAAPIDQKAQSGRLRIKDPDPDTKLMHGKVPQLEDWVDVWAAVSTRMAINQMSKYNKKVGSGHKQRWQYQRARKQVAILAEVLRERTRKRLREATCITLALDASQYRKVVRFRCDTPQPAAGGEYVARGILGIVSCTKESTAAFEEDHAISAVRSLDAFLTRFCTSKSRARQPLALDLPLKEHIIQHILTFAADGAASQRRELFFAIREVCTNCKLLIRDAAHALRIAYNKPVHADDAFGEVWDKLFGERHALAPDLMNSPKWMDHLRAIQKDVRSTPVQVPMNGQPLALVFNTISFAKQRFDSTAEPVAKLALMLVPVATLLAYIGADVRHEKAKRDRARELLKRFNAKFCTALGLSADWGLVCKAFLRLFDEANHDIASSTAEVKALIKTLEALFVEARVFLRPGPAAAGAADIPAIGRSLKDAGASPLFITHYVQRQLQTRFVFRCGNDLIQPWGPCTQADMVELSHRMHNVAKTTISRIRADFPANDMRAWLRVFDCKNYLPFMARDTSDAQKAALLRDFGSLATELGYTGDNWNAAVLEYCDVSGPILAATAKGQPLANKTNPQVWSTVLPQEYRARGRVAPLRVLPQIIRFYISIEDGECQVERDFSCVRSFITSTGNAAKDDYLEDLLLVKTMGPASKDELVDPATGGLTDLSRACARMWRDIHGARLGCGGGKRKRRPKGRTFATIMHGVEKAAAGATATHGILMATNAAAGAVQQSIGGVPHAVLRCPASSTAGAPQNPYRNKMFAKFDKATKSTMVRTSLGRFVRGAIFKRSRAAAKPKPLSGIRTVAWLEPMPPGAPAFLRQEGQRKCMRADLVITGQVNSLFSAQTLSGNETLTIDLIYMMATRKPLITASSWALAEGQPAKVPPEAIIRHLEPKEACQYSAAFAEKHWAVAAALDKCARLAAELDSDWRPRKTAAGVNVVNTLHELAEKLMGMRRIENASGPRGFTSAGPAAV